MENAPQTNERSYIAFISYRHTPLDSEAAERVQKKIENYIVPKELQKQAGGKKLGLCFRDEDELPASSSLTDSIYYALDHSKYLIVICTPDLPLSKWCEAEIKHFLKTHDRDHILAVLVDGDPAESFSPYMLHDFDEEGNITKDWEPLAANINGPGHTIDKKAFKKEIVRIYAALIGCPFDALWQRERRARTNRMLSAAGAAVAVLAIFLGVVLNRNAQIAAQNEQIKAANKQITAQNDELTEKNDEIQKQNDQITEQNVQIENQNTRLQRELSSTLVDSGINKLQKNDIHGALEDALSATESDDPTIYDPRAEKLLADSLGAYQRDKIQCSVVYQQSTDIVDISISEDENHALLLDSVGVIRCLGLSDYSVLWEIDTGDPHSRIYTKNQTDQILYKSKTGLYCHSLTDGALQWSYTHSDRSRNYFQAISADGTWFALLDPVKSDASDEVSWYLIFFNTQDGSERGRVELSCDGYDLNIFSFNYFYEYGFSFSPDNSCFLIAIPATPSENPDDWRKHNTVSFVVDTKSFESKVLFTYDTKMDRFFCMDMTASDDTVFVAGYSSALSKIRSELIAKDGESYSDTAYSDYGEIHIGGVVVPADHFDSSVCEYLVNGEIVYIFADNQLFIYNRTENTLIKNYALSGKVINAYWLDQKKRIAEVVCSDGYFVDYIFGDNNQVVIDGGEYESIGQKNLIKACPINDGFIYAPDTGSTLVVSEDYPGNLFLVKRVSDPHCTRIDLRPSGSEIKRVDKMFLTPGLDTSLFFYHDNDYNSRVLFFDKQSGETRAIPDYKDFTFIDSSVVQLDEDSFLHYIERYNLDGTVEYYEEPCALPLLYYFDNKNLRLTDGSILSWNSDSSYYALYEEFEDSLFPSKGKPAIVPIWLNGHIIPGTDDPKTGLLYYDEDGTNLNNRYGNPYSNYYETVMNLPLIDAGENGLVMTYGKPLYYDGETITLEEEPLFRFLDVQTGAITTMKNPYPNSGQFLTALSKKNKWMAAVYDDGNVCIYDLANNNTMIPKKKWAAGEITALCFSPDDAYLLILTAIGELDVIDTSSMETVFDETIPIYSDLIHHETNPGYFSRLYAEYTSTKDHLIINANSYGDTYGILLNITDRTVTQFFGKTVAYDFDNSVIWRDSETEGVYLTYPLYTLQDLKTWAEEELGE
ncbi:MAG: TIR domain-containing protein [Parasporobacterium sp.]|nr:TIR domain-containing protein [Parasporobacterium sp.]